MVTIRKRKKCSGRSYEPEDDYIKPKVSLPGRLFRFGIKTVPITAVAIAAGLIAGQVYLKTTLIPQYTAEHLDNIQTKLKPTIISADGANLGSFNDDFILEDRLKVNSVNPIVKDILISSEDRNFYEFPGINIFSLLKATGEYLAGGDLRGGSTIDMQLAKLIKGDTKQTFMRKFQDIYLAAAIEDSFRKKYGEENYKDRILLEYLSWAYFGHGKYGINSACEYFFEKINCDGITMKEAAFLTGILPYPNSYSANEKIANERGDFILEIILTDKNMTRKYGEEFIKRQKEQRIVFSNFEPENPFPFIAEAVRKEAEKLVGKRVYTDGITIHTTINYKMQVAGEEAMRVGFENADKIVMPFKNPFRTVIENGVEKKIPILVDGGFIAINPRNGFVRVYVGGRDWNDSQNLFSEAWMQIGSGMKPPIYGTFIQRGEGDKNSIIIDSPLCIPGKCFRNYDGIFKGKIPVWEALRQSRNIPATKILMKAGIGNVMEKFYLLGVDNQLIPNVQFALGASEVSPREIAAAISTLTDGYYNPSTLIEYIEDSQGIVIFDNRNRAVAHKVWNSKTTSQMTEMMQRVCLPDGTVRKVCETLEGHFGVPMNPAVNPKFDFTKHPLNAAPDAMCKTGTETNSTRAGLICTYSDTDFKEMLTVVDYIGYRQPWPMSGKVNITGGVLSAPVHIKFIEMVATPGNKFKSFKDRREELASGQYNPSVYDKKMCEEDKLVAFGDQKLEEIAVCGENACGDGLMRKLLELEESDFRQIVNSLGIRMPEPRIKYGSRNDIKRKGLAKILHKFMEMRSSHEVTRELSKIEKIADETLNGYNVYTEVCTVGPKKECSTSIQGYEFSKEIKNISYLKAKDCIKDCIVALKYADSKGKLHTFLRDGSSLKDVNVVNARIKGGAFATSCLKNGIKDAQRIELQNMTPHVNYARINKGFSYRVMFSGKKIIAAEIRETDSNLDVRKISKVVTIDDRCVNDKGYDCQGKEWPTKKGKIFFYNLYDDVNESNIRGIAQIRAKEGTDTTAFGRGIVAFVDREYGTMVINYEKGYSVQYDGIFTKLKRGDSVNGSELIGEVDNRNNLFIRAIKGEAPLNLRNQQEVYTIFKKNVADITSILPRAKKLKEANIEAEMQYRLRILEFLTTPFDESQTTGDISNLAKPNAGVFALNSNYSENTRSFLRRKEGRRFA